MNSTKSKVVNRFIIGTFVSLYLLVSIISTIHVVDFFRLSNPEWLAISLAIGFELGAAASLAALITLEKMNKNIVWGLFILITGMQMQGNMYYAYTNIKEYQGWVELFNLVEWEPISQKRLLACVSGAILPLVALGFIKSLVDYIKPEGDVEPTQVEDLDVIHEEVESMRKVVDSYDSLQEEMDDWERASLEDFVDEDELAGFIPDDNYNIEEEVQLDDYPPIEFDVIDVKDVKDETGLVDSVRTGETRTVGAPEVMTVYDANKRNYIPIKEKNVC
jgi:hypothetical protein